MSITFHVPEHWRVFVLDDTQERLRWFRERLPEMKSAKTAQDAIAILAEEEFELVFLDHDLSFMDAADVTRQFRNGKEVARYLAITKFPGRIVIHSRHESGAELMAKILPQATIARFGEFEIVAAKSQRTAQ